MKGKEGEERKFNGRKGRFERQGMVWEVKDAAGRGEGEGKVM